MKFSAGRIFNSTVWILGGVLLVACGKDAGGAAGPSALSPTLMSENVPSPTLMPTGGQNPTPVAADGLTPSTPTTSVVADAPASATTPTPIATDGLTPTAAPATSAEALFDPDARKPTENDFRT